MGGEAWINDKGEGEEVGALEVDFVPLSPLTDEDFSIERCILNDERVIQTTWWRTLVTIFMPILQACVVCATKIFLSEGKWYNDVSVTLGERTLAHYCAHVQEEGTGGILRL